MNARQRLFVGEYLVDLNATQAAIRSGYSAKTAASIGQENLIKPEIATAIDAAMKARAARTFVTQDRVLDELAVLGFSSVDDYVIDEDGMVALTPAARPDAIRAVSSIKRKRRVIPVEDGEPIIEVETEIKMWDKPAALRLSGQHLGMYVERHEVSAAKGTGVLAVPVPIDSAAWAELAAKQQADLVKSSTEPGT